MRIDKTHIEAIIFDLGGVILNLDYHLTIKAFENLGMKNAEELFSQKSQTSFFDDFETGKISTSKFMEEVRRLIDHSVTDVQIENAWNAMLLDFPRERFTFIQSISSKKRIFLLSNTNEIHMRWFKNYVNGLFGTDVFFNLFEVAYLSNEVGMRKPNEEIFEMVIRENQLSASQTLFIDDSAQHIEGAKLTDLQTYLLEPDEVITDLLRDFLA